MSKASILAKLPREKVVGIIRANSADGLLDCPHYTRPVEHETGLVPEVLLSGNHAEIARWRRRQALLRTRERRPDLLAAAGLSAEEVRWLDAQDGVGDEAG